MEIIKKMQKESDERLKEMVRKRIRDKESQ